MYIGIDIEKASTPYWMSASAVAGRQAPFAAPIRRAGAPGAPRATQIEPGEMTRTGKEFSRAEVRRILLENRYCLTEKELCSKWGISCYRLRVWKRENNYRYLSGGRRELVIAALYRGVVEVSGVIEFADYMNHCRYSEGEVLEVLQALDREGKARLRGSAWTYREPVGEAAPQFIF